MNENKGMMRRVSAACDTCLAAPQTPWIMAGLGAALMASTAWGWLAALGVFVTATALAFALAAIGRIGQVPQEEAEPADTISSCQLDRSCAGKPCCAPAAQDAEH